MLSCEEYGQDVFVDRPAALEKIRVWADGDFAAIKKRVMPIVAPPGGGKTWILKFLEQEWNGSSGRFVALMDIPNLVNLEEKENRDHLIKLDAFEIWFGTLQDAAARRFSISPVSGIPDISAILSEFVKLLCDCNPTKAPIILVDGYDELTDAQAEVFSARILQPLHERDCIRLIIAHRPERSIRGDAIRRNLQVPPLNLHEADPLSFEFALDQFRMLYQKNYPGQNPPDISSWIRQLQHYQWNHPLANCFFFHWGMKNNWTALTDPIIYQCCQRVIERPDGNGKPRFPLQQDGYKFLHRIANELPDQWSQADIEPRLNINNFYLDETIQKLFEVGSIINVSPVPPLYQICGGLRDLLREISVI